MKSLSPNTKTIVKEMIAGLGVPKGHPLLFHCAFSNLGNQGISPISFIDSLIEASFDTTLLFVTHTWKTQNSQNCEFSELETPSHTGILGETFRLERATHRSLHPTHSVAAFGPLSDSLLNGHHLRDTPISDDSPYLRHAHSDGWTVLINVGLNFCTLMHYFEEAIAPDLYLEPPEHTESYICTNRRGEKTIVRTRRHLKKRRDYDKFLPILEETGLLRRHSIGGTNILAFPSSVLLKAFQPLVMKNPAMLLADYA